MDEVSEGWCTGDGLNEDVVVSSDTGYKHIAPREEAGNGSYQVTIHRPIGRTAVAEAQRRAESAREEHKKALKRKRNDDSGSAEDNKPPSEGYERRLHLNRQSAAAARVRRETYTKELEKSLNDLEGQNIGLHETVMSLQRERDQLKSEVEMLKLRVEYISAVQNNQSAQAAPAADNLSTFFAEEKEVQVEVLQHWMEANSELLRDFGLVDYSIPEKFTPDAA
mmetsp:Transcript_8282/g.14997  ORF Transcript_8282/g.14997 Transcript_8282/m.14997 type:complete len:223 (-) Transcript_8282:138-806(-)|eukprot:CAMPEP_0182442188 /NCGR_PEP_ID=MMETSP1172-20130603/1137_1 /TAXON_ID=708627 /ORGANISM="Timspurckia oligopyrenoides, Strain CCMP3278" /LENGTH=222 /DNA_ID=CAMNT_0024636921 /DNA_START=107 /DNA_END=775 /DNA_ORIENTATION=-